MEILTRQGSQEITPVAGPKVSPGEKSVTPPPTAPNGLAWKDSSPSSTPLEKSLDSLSWAPRKTLGREWIRIKDYAELKQALGLIQEKAVNGYCTIGRHVYRIEGDFLGRYPKHESAKA